MRAFTITSADVARCPIGSWSARHYRVDGSCLCADDDEWPQPRVVRLLRALVADGLVRVRRWPCGHAHRYVDRAASCPAQGAALPELELTP